MIRIKTYGFTLLEIIITITVASILTVMVYTFLSDSFMDSSVPIQRLQECFELQSAMENISSDYEYMVSNPTPGVDVLEFLKSQVATPDYYGSYQIIFNDFIDFPEGGGNEQVGGGNEILKITIRSENCGSLTALFSSSN
ncbi:MAG: prepilin-type N-terminal cleavage/methylation domain-containing protein [Desulfobacterales bacterium]|nr:prepilin-type N-terminal cleavage/methylation domain-containing protein [Desulfobacterales bacterium]